MEDNSVGHADVITIKPSYNRFNLDIYEVKVSRADILQDIKKGKYKRYLPHCHRLYFAAISGIIKKEEIPEDVGLIVRGENGWKTIKSAKKRDVIFDNQTLLALLFYRGRNINKKRIDIANNGYIKNRFYKHQLKGFGKDIRNMILNYNNLEMKFKNLLYECSKKIQFSSEEEKNLFIEKWEKKTYIYDW